MKSHCRPKLSTLQLKYAHLPGFNEDGRGHLHRLAKPAPKFVDGSQLSKLHVCMECGWQDKETHKVYKHYTYFHISRSDLSCSSDVLDTDFIQDLNFEKGGCPVGPGCTSLKRRSLKKYGNIAPTSPNPLYRKGWFYMLWGGLKPTWRTCIIYVSEICCIYCGQDLAGEGGIKTGLWVEISQLLFPSLSPRIKPWYGTVWQRSPEQRWLTSCTSCLSSLPIGGSNNLRRGGW